jgi:hypothetical protein
MYHLRELFNILVKMDFKILSQTANLLSKLQTSNFMNMKQECYLPYYRIL